MGAATGDYFLNKNLEIEEELSISVYAKADRPIFERSTPWVNSFYSVLVCTWSVILYLNTLGYRAPG
jgi:hypothetical protein